jgi:hypothetical protein
VYSLSFAQVLNNQGRNRNITTRPTIPGEGTFSSFRLKQSMISTRLLQALLMGMVLCSIISFLAVRLSKGITKESMQHRCTGQPSSWLAVGDEFVSQVAMVE